MYFLIILSSIPTVSRLLQVNQDALENLFSLLRACFGGNNTKPTPMKVCQGLKIIMLTKLDNLGALLCDGAPVMFQDSGEHEMDENFLSSNMVSYKEVQDAFKQAEGDEDMMTMLDNIDNRMPLDESHLDPHIEEYIGGWVERKVFEKKTIYLFMHSSSFQCDYPVVAPTPGGFTALQSYGGLRGCTDQTRSHLRTIDAAFNQIHGTGPQLAALKNPIKTSIGRISLQFSHIPKAVIKVNLINFCYLWPPIIVSYFTSYNLHNFHTVFFAVLRHDEIPP